MIMARGSGANSSDQAILIWAGLWGRNWRYWRFGGPKGNRRGCDVILEGLPLLSKCHFYTYFDLATNW